jgi:hypothetical protein
MSHDVDEWFADPAVGADWQDMDLVLADVQLLPRLKSYLADPSSPQFKKVEVVSALLELLEHDCPRDGSVESERLAEDLQSAIRQHSEVSTRALRELGPVKEVVLRSILGLPIPADYPQWIIDRAREEGA